MAKEIQVKGEILSTITGKTLNILNETNLQHVYSKMQEEVIVTITPYKKNRSHAQNRWYWGVAVQSIIEGIKEQTGENYTKEEIHKFNLQEVCKVKFNTRTILGKTVMIFEDVSTSKMNTEEFNIFKTELQMYWSERDIVIPDPNQDSFLNDY